MRLLILLLTFGNDALSQKFHTLPHEPCTRATPYRARVMLKMCLLKPDPGPCRSDIAMYYFKPDTMSCTRFSWGGCQGNGNRFDTKKECLDTCLSQRNSHIARPPWCLLTFDYGFCFGAIKRWYFDRQWKVCKETIYSGCGGNQNNFYNLAQCDSICRFNKGPIKEKPEIFGDPKKVLIINPPNGTTAKTTINAG